MRQKVLGTASAWVPLSMMDSPEADRRRPRRDLPRADCSRMQPQAQASPPAPRASGLLWFRSEDTMSRVQTRDERTTDIRRACWKAIMASGLRESVMGVSLRVPIDCTRCDAVIACGGDESRGTRTCAEDPRAERSAAVGAAERVHRANVASVRNCVWGLRVDARASVDGRLLVIDGNYGFTKVCGIFFVILFVIEFFFFFFSSTSEGALAGAQGLFRAVTASVGANQVEQDQRRRQVSRQWKCGCARGSGLSLSLCFLEERRSLRRQSLRTNPR
jgi:hypothetical protein